MEHYGQVDAGSTLRVFFTTATEAGAAVAPSSAFEAADVRIYKDGSATQRSSEAGYTMTSPFDSVTGLHLLSVDLSDNTDAGFYAAGSRYTIILIPDETVGGVSVVRVLADFTIGPVAANVTQVNGGATDGYNATLKLKALDIENNAGNAIRAASTGSNGHGMSLAGHGSGSGLHGAGGATGHGLRGVGGSTSGNGVNATGGADSVGLYAEGQGVGYGLYAIGGEDGSGAAFVSGTNEGHGIVVSGRATTPGYAGMQIRQIEDGRGLEILGGTDSPAVAIEAAGDAAGIRVVGGTNGAGLHAIGGPTSGAGIKAEAQDAGSPAIDAPTIAGNLTGTVDGLDWPEASVVADGSNSASSFKTDLTETDDLFWKDTFVRFTSGALAEQVRKVTGYNGTTKFITIDAATATPANGVTFVLINR